MLATLALSATITVGLLVSYVTFLALLFVWICLELHALTKVMAFQGILHWELVQHWMYFFGLGVTWLFMLRPLRTRRGGPKVAMQVFPGTQPQLFDLIHLFCWHLRVAPPSEVWLDTSISVRTGMLGGLKGILTGQSVLHLGMPVISVITAKELAGLLAKELGYASGGVGALFVHAIRELDNWYYQAAMERDPWVMHLLEPKAKKETAMQRLVRNITRAWMWLAKVPFLILALAARSSAKLAFWLMDHAANRCGANVIGAEGMRRMQHKLSGLANAWEAAKTEVRRGISQYRLPENLSLLIARHVAHSMRESASEKARSGALPGVSEVPNAAESAGAKGAFLVAHLPATQPAATILKNFVEMSRQATYFHYQHDLELNLNEFRMVADEEVLHQNRREDECLLAIRRYFGGMAHPERAMCGLGPTHAAASERAALVREILRVRQELLLWGPQHRAALQEWNIAWQRRRDLEAAAVLSTAGFAVSRAQFATEDTTPAVLRTESSRQRLVMENMEGPLQDRERTLECRFASALGLIWWAQESELTPELLKRRETLPGWVTIFEAMCGALPSFRELLTIFFGFQTLGARFTNMDDPGALLAALQSIVPKMLNLIHQVIATMDGAVYPFAEDGRTVSLNDHLLPRPLPQSSSAGISAATAAEMKAIALEMASQASENIAPYVDAFLSLYHRSYAWLCETAEQAENHFMGGSCLSGATEVLLPHEFMSRKLSLSPQTAIQRKMAL